MSKSHPQQGAINHEVERPDRELVAALSTFATTQIADCGGPVGVVGPELRRLAGGTELCGPAVTVWTRPGDILYVLKATDLITAGDVLVVDSGGRADAAVIGDIAGQTIADLGCVGMVVDGAVRDLDGLDEIGLPTFAGNAHPATGSNQGPGAINVPVTSPADRAPGRRDPRGHQRGGRRAAREAGRGGRADPRGSGAGDRLAGRHRGRAEPARGHRHRRPARRPAGRRRAGPTGCWRHREHTGGASHPAPSR